MLSFSSLCFTLPLAARMLHLGQVGDGFQLSDYISTKRLITRASAASPRIRNLPIYLSVGTSTTPNLAPLLLIPYLLNNRLFFNIPNKKLDRLWLLHRSTEYITLYTVTAVINQIFQLLFSFHALGDYRQTKYVCHANNGTDDFCHIDISLYHINKWLVDFQGFHC